MDSREAQSVHAIVTDPPYGLKEYTDVEQRKLRKGRGGVWRIPPSFDGCKRNPVPRFTVLADNEKSALRFVLWGIRAASISSNPLRVSGNARHLLLRAIAVGASVGFSFVGSLILLKVTDAPVDLGANAESEPIGLDISEHEEPSYAFDA